LISRRSAAAGSVCLTQAVVEIRRGERPRIVELFLELPSRDRLRACEQDIENRSWLANKKVVVWEFVERDIRFGTEGWQKTPVP
jgi:hypothetical protein